MYNPNENRFGDPEDQFTRPPKRAGSPLAMASLTLSIIGIVSVVTVYGGIVFGGLAVLLGFLSKGAKTKPERPAKYGIRVGIISIVISAVLVTSSFLIVHYQYGGIENFYQKYLYTLEQNYGLDLDSELPLMEDSGDIL